MNREAAIRKTSHQEDRPSHLQVLPTQDEMELRNVHCSTHCDPSDLGCTGGVICLSPARADFVLVEDFEDYLPGSISTQGGWSAASPTTVVDLDPENSENQVLSVTTNSTLARLDLLGANSPILNGTVRMAFLRFRVGSQQNYSFGFTHVTNPSEFSDFGPEVGMSNSSLDLRVFDGDGDMYQELASLSADSWYNLWMLVDAENDTTRLWLNTSDDAAEYDNALTADDNSETFSFRSANQQDLIRFYIKTGGGSSQNSGPLFIDDLYIESSNALNLGNPVSGELFLAADFDDDGDVDGEDFLVWQLGFGIVGDADREDGDADNDEDVDGEDFLVWQSEFGSEQDESARLAAAPNRAP